MVILLLSVCVITAVYKSKRERTVPQAKEHLSVCGGSLMRLISWSWLVISDNSYRRLGCGQLAAADLSQPRGQRFDRLLLLSEGGLQLIDRHLLRVYLPVLICQ